MAFLKYPKHFYERIRIEIAASQIKHDFRKLFADLPQKDFSIIDKNIDEWFEGEKFELEPVREFWDFFSGITRGLKLKSLLAWITAENVEWSKEKIKTDKIIITWDFPGLEFMDQAPYKAVDVMHKLSEKNLRQAKKALTEDSKERSRKYHPRDQFPIVVFEDKKGGVLGKDKGYYILEGNRRTVKAIVERKDEILSYVGRFKTDEDFWPMDYWINTGILRDLIFFSIGYNKAQNKESFDVVRKFYQLLLRDFDIARIATIDKSFKNFEKDEALLLDIMLKDLK